MNRKNELRTAIGANVPEIEGGRIVLLLTLLKESVAQCYAHDKILIDRGMEQASVARVFYYMQKALEHDPRFESIAGYNLDSEYNKKGKHIKETKKCRNGTRPDIILHKRRISDIDPHDNLLVLEFKPRKTNFKYYKHTRKTMDFVKLEDFTDVSVYNYSLGVFIKLNKRGAKYTYFQNGKVTAEPSA